MLCKRRKKERKVYKTVTSDLEEGISQAMYWTNCTSDSMYVGIHGTHVGATKAWHNG